MTTITLKAFDGLARKLVTSGQKVNLLAHELGCFAMAHAEACGDIRRMDTVLVSMRQGHLRAEGFKVWVETFSPIRWNKDGGIGLAKVGAKGFTPFDVGAATATPFYALDAAKEVVKPADMSIESLVAFFNKKLQQAESADVVTGEISDKTGKVTGQVKGNVVSLKAFASKLRVAVANASSQYSVSDAVNSAAEKIAAIG